MTLRKLFTFVSSLLLLLALAASSVFAQGRASVRGSITDEFGAVIVGATVTLTDANGVKKTATSGADGGYSFTGLAPGKYSISAAAGGFATSDVQQIDVANARREPFNITLKVATIES